MGNFSLSNDFHSNRYVSIQALRGITALFIIFEHVRFLNCGAFGVDIFFCISGFMIMFSTHNSVEHFFLKRIIRILPLYYIMTIGTFFILLMIPSLFETTKADPVYLIKSLLFIPFDIGDGAIQPLMRIGWTVNCEMFFYILFFISFHISFKYRGLICSMIISAIVVISHVIPNNFIPLKFYGEYYMLDFVYGIICYYICRGIYKFIQNDHGAEASVFKGRKTMHIISIGSLFLLITIYGLLAATKHNIDITGLGRPIYWGLPCVLIVVLCFIAGLFIKVPGILSALGDISFSIYLVHYYPVMLLDRKVFNFEFYNSKAVLGVILSIAICLIFSSISYLIIEKKLTKKLYRLTHIM